MLKPIHLLLLLAAICLCSTGTTAQTSSQKITPKETREVNEFAHRFAARLLKSKDIKPLVSIFYARDFLERSLKNENSAWSLLLEKDLAVKQTPSELRRFYFAENNWFYLAYLVTYSKYSSEAEHFGTFEGLFSPRLIRTLRLHPVI